jgi:two-component system LytT family sensor kinase
MKKKKITIALIVAVIFSVLFALLFKWAQTGDPFQPETILYGTIILLDIIILGSIANRAFYRYSRWSSDVLRKRMAGTFLLFVLLALVISLLLVSGGVYAFFLIRGLDTSHFLSNLIHLELPGALKQFSIWILIGSAAFFFLIWRKAIGREQELREENLKYRYRTLKSQVNPHFLFNSLNTLSELVYQDPEKADAYIQKLAAIYRYILDHEDSDLVPLKEEMEFVRQIRLDIELPGSDTYSIIPVSLQILVENALKHNARSEGSPLEIRIRACEGYLEVSNPVQPRNQMQDTPGTGLTNLQERVRLIMGKELTVSEENNRFIAKMPYFRSA